MIDIHRNGLRLFTYCTEPVKILSSFIATGLLWLDNLVADYVPFLAGRPTEF